MSALEPQYMAMLERVLDADYVPHLPPLLDTSKPEIEKQKKNRSRAFSAFALRNLCQVSIVDAAKAVVDDFDDHGVDAVFYDAATGTLFIVQSKLKASEQFHQDDGLAFCQGVRKLLRQDFDGFNKNVQCRVTEIDGALENCKTISLVVAHTGSGISQNAQAAINELLADQDLGEIERLTVPSIDYDSKCVLADLLVAKAHQKINASLWVQNCSHVSDPRTTYFGLIGLGDLVKLHSTYGEALYAKNIRSFLGHKTDVNVSIQRTLETAPEEFLYLNNGVTVLCEIIDSKNSKGGKKLLKVRGLSVINGAQTIASSARFAATNDISKAKVTLTIVKAGADSDFGKSVTRARNHQNPVRNWDFAALDDEQERLRRELAHLGITYAYKPDSGSTGNDPQLIRIDEAANALATLHADPRYVVWLKKEPTRFLDTESPEYKSLFGGSVSAFRLANAVRANRYFHLLTLVAGIVAGGTERLTYRHGSHALAWVLAKRLRVAIDSSVLIDESKLKTELSKPFDDLRQTLWDKSHATEKGPLSLFRNQTHLIPLLRDIAVEHYGLAADPVLVYKNQQQKAGQLYPEELFTYLAAKAPQIGNLA
jgi:hypothetical protein